MKKIFLAMAWTLLASVAQALDDREIRFLYIAHDYTTPLDALTERLRDEYNDALSDDSGSVQTVFYLANGTRPVVVKLNTPDDNRDDFEHLLMAELIERNAHDVEPEVDVTTITNIFDSMDIASPDIESELSFTFFTTPLFWSVNNNESVIASLYYILDIPYVRQHGEFPLYGNRVPRLTYEIYHPRNNQADYNKEMPFGVKNLGDINNYLKNSIAPL